MHLNVYKTIEIDEFQFIFKMGKTLQNEKQ